MPAVNWNTVWTAVVTAGFVTLAVEYAVKPRLEARKEEILAGLRARREIKTLIMQMTLAAQKFGTVLPAGVDRGLEQRWKEERDRQYVLVVDRARRLSDGLDLYAGTYREPLLSLITEVAFTMYAVLLSPRQRRRQAELIVELGTLMLPVLAFPAPWKVWRYTRWMHAVEEVRRLVARIQAEAEQPERTQRSA